MMADGLVTQTEPFPETDKEFGDDPGRSCASSRPTTSKASW